MSRSWMLAAPAALALLAGCATQPAPAPMAMPMMAAPMAMAPAPAYVPPSASTTMNEEAAPVRTQRRRAMRRARPSNAEASSPGTYSNRTTAPISGRGGMGTPAVGAEQTTSGPSAVGRRPAPAQPVGNSGS